MPKGFGFDQEVLESIRNTHTYRDTGRVYNIVEIMQCFFFLTNQDETGF